jgi:pimeloyl-ACP methyl ester carboxylesterase
MKLKAILIVLIGAFSGAAIAASYVATAPTSYEGLVSVQSRNLDKLYIRPNAELARYQKVMIDPVTVEFSKEWDRNVNDPRYTTRVRPEDARRIAEETTANVGDILGDTFKARGYEIVAAPGPGVLRLSPHVTELYVNAPDIFPPGRTRSLAREAGEATVILEARDASNGTLLAVVADHGTAREMLHLSRANNVSNSFWFDGMFRRFAARGVDAIKDRPRT